MDISNDIAVVGMAGRFPGARNVAEFWRNIRDGLESVTFFSDDEVMAAGVDRAALEDPNYVKAAAVLPDMEMFDAGFFSLSPKDAAIMDPQHRQFLECAWESLENAGHTPDSFEGSIGVYAGSGMNAYMMFNLLRNQRLVRDVGLFLLRHTGNDKDFLATRVSYELNLQGPSVSIQTACSTSLVAIHMACQSLLGGECDMALAGAVTIGLHHGHGYLYREGEILSRDGHCRPFDAAATGTLFGDGAGVVVLRRLEDALEDGDHIHAIVKGSAINNDGSVKAGYLAPSVDGQSAAIAEAIRMAEVEPDTISYFEAHGAGTAIGDVIEVKALSQAFGQRAGGDQPCAIGTVKSNIGHLDTAAGVAGFIKTVLALENRQLPPTLHFKEPNPQIDFASSPFYVNARLQDWRQAQAHPRRAGVSSLGVGGTNAHVILEEAQQVASQASTRPWRLLTLSARSEAALEAATDNLGDYLSEVGGDIGDEEFTLQVGRKALEWRRFVVCRNASDGREALSRLKRAAALKAEASEPRVAFLFPGGGAQHAGMAADLYQHEPVYRSAVDQAREFVRSRWGFDFLPWVYPSEGSDQDAGRRLEQPSLALPALLACEYALAQLWRSWGVEPESMIGHSMGEYTAACLAGVMSFEDALALVVVRGRLFEKLAPGAMLSVGLSERELRPLLSNDLSIAAVNGRELCVASGEAASIAALEESLNSRGVESRRVRIAVAAHSAMVEPILDEFRGYLRTMRFEAPRTPYLSNVTGTWITPQQAQDPEYWVTHLRSTVRYSDGVRTLLTDPDRILLEVGPGQSLTSLVRLEGDSSAQRALASLPHPKESDSARRSTLIALGRLWQAGKDIDWKAFHDPDPRRRVPLPTYPFEHQRYWIEPDQPQQSGAQPNPPEKDSQVDSAAEWFYRPVWKRSTAPSPRRESDSDWLVFADATGVADRLLAELSGGGLSATVVEVGDHFARLATDRYSIAPSSPDDYLRLVQELKARTRFPSRIAHLWTVTEEGASPPGMLDLGFYSLLFFAQALAAENVEVDMRLAIVSKGMQQVGREPLQHAEKATLLGPCRVIPREFANISCRSIDISRADDFPAGALIEELTHACPPDATVAYRDGQRWVQAVEPSPLGAVPAGESALRQGGVYLITGGYGGLGLALAEHLARTVRARLVLVGRGGLPDRSEWPVVVPRKNTVSAQIQKVLQIERLGAEVLTLSADVSDASQMRAAIEQAQARFGAIHGIFHTAGVLDDGLIALKTRESAESVLRPKVQGTLVLEALAADCGADFLVYYSSISSHLGLAGQSDYAAANAFLNAHADSRSNADDLRVVSINWPTWREAGMAVAAKSAADGVAVPHPLLGRRREDRPGRVVYSASYGSKTHWVLDEHRSDEASAVVPGTAYAEIARAVAEHEAPGASCEIEELLLLNPLIVANDDTRQIRITLDQVAGAGEWKLAIASKAAGSDWLQNARAKIRPLGSAPPEPIEIPEIRARCSEREIVCGPDWRSEQERRLTFGRRWRCLERILLGQDEALAEIAIPPDFAADLETFGVHPALLDQATGFALPLVEGYGAGDDFYVPMAYQKVRVHRPLASKLVAHARYRGSDQGTVAFDVTVANERGEVLLEIEQFTMRRIDPGASFGIANRAGERARPSDSDNRSLLDELLASGIDLNQGLQALDRILAHDSPSQVIVTPVAPAALEKLLASRGRSATPERRGPARAMVTPRTPVETYLAEAWSAALGLEQVGVEDNWFELGGHSLLGIRIISQVHRKYRIQLSLSLFFDSPTVSSQARSIEKELAEARPAESDGLIPVGREQYRKRRQDVVTR